jgi:hypothetical protein
MVAKWKYAYHKQLDQPGLEECAGFAAHQTQAARVHVARKSSPNATQ